MSKYVKKIVKAAAIVAAVVFTGGTALLATIGKALVTTAISIGVSRLIAKRASLPAEAGGDGGARIQLPPATVNKLPIVYGTAFIGGSITDAMLSTDQKTMWYVLALAEHSDDQGGGGGSYSFDTNKCYYDGKQIQFGTDGAVTGLITNTSTPQVDTRCNGYLYVYLFNNGSSSGINTGGQTAAQILSVANGVPASKAWTAGQQTMTNCAFAIIKVIYNTDAGTTGVGQLMVNMTNSLTKPGECILDYMLNERYGCGLPIESIDTASLTYLDAYSDELIDYKPVGWVTGDPYAQQSRYRINGPLDTGQTCLNNLQFLVDSADSWLQYSELTGLWKVVVNQDYTDNPATPTLNDLFLVNSSNLIGGIEVSPIDLNETYNQIEVAYPNTNIKDQTDYYIIDLFEDDPQLLSPNEAINRLNVTLPLVNNAVQARYLAARRIYQSREDLVIAFRLDYSGIQLEAGDVIRVTHEVYGWSNKLFRVNNVAETKDEGGNLFADIQAFEYSDAIYNDIVEDYIPAFNTGLIDPNVISPPGTPVIVAFTDANALITGFNVTSTSPANGIVLYMDFNYGTTSNVFDHRLYRTVQQANSAPYAANTSVTIPVNDLPANNYYWSTTARNNTSGKRSNSSNLFAWGGANIQPWNGNTNTGGINGNQIGSNTLTYRNFSSSLNLSVNIGGNTYAIAEGNPGANLSPVLLPVYANANTTRNVPLYIPPNLGWTTNGTYPYRQGTSSTTAGTDGRRYYGATSTGSYTPANAAKLLIADGEDNWYMATVDDVAGLLGQYKTYTNNTGFTVVSDEDGSIIQIVQGVEYNNSGYYECQTNRMDTLEMPFGNFQYSWQRTYSVTTSTGNAGNITGGATFIRNISNSATITLTSGTIQSSAAGSIYY